MEIKNVFLNMDKDGSGLHFITNLFDHLKN